MYMAGPGCNSPGPLGRLLRLIAGLAPALCYSFIASAEMPTPMAGRQSCSVTTQAGSYYLSATTDGIKSAPDRPYELVARYPHDRSAFTQGLVFYRGALYESTGMQGRSSIRRIDLDSGRLLNQRRLDKAQFGEGLAVLDRKLVQLTWESGVAFVYSPADLRRIGSFAFSGEGWGGTAIDARLVVSDGSSWLRFFDGKDQRQVGRLQVMENGRPLEGLNELEAVGDLIYANVYPSDCIAQIDARSGRVVGWIDLGGLMPLSERPNASAVANGIAVDPQTGELLVTGKLWPYIYRLRLRLRQTDTRSDKRAAAAASLGQRLKMINNGG